ncbi:MAG: PEP-CTERM sorting domain-containing protein [Phycisphaeraceae bacterium]
MYADPPRRLALVAALACLLWCSPAAFAVSWNAGDGDWFDPANWSPVGVPDSSAVEIGNLNGVQNSIVTLTPGGGFDDQGTSIYSLDITDAMWLRLNDGFIDVTTDTHISGRNQIQQNPTILRPSTLFVRTDGNFFHRFATNNLILSDHGQLWVEDDGRVQIGEKLTIASTSYVVGDGTIAFYDSGEVLVNNGEIRHGSQNPNTPLVFQADFGGLFDLDGTTGNGHINLFTSNPGEQRAINFIGTGLTDDFDGTISISGGNVLNMNLDEGWTLGVAGQLDFHPGNGNFARLAGEHVTIKGNVRVGPFGGDNTYARIQSDATVASGAQINLYTDEQLNFTGTTTINGGTFDLSQGGWLQFDGPTHVNGGTFNTPTISAANGQVRFHGDTTWSGTVNFNGHVGNWGDAHVTGVTTINADIFAMNHFDSTWTLDRALTINALSLQHQYDNGGSKHTDADFVINSFGFNGGKLTVNLTPDGFADRWSSFGDITINGPGDALISVSLEGSDVHLRGNTTVNGNTLFNARIDLDNAFILLNADAVLRLNGGSIAEYNTLSLGTILGPGELQAASGKALFGHGLIQAPVAFIGSAELRADGGLLQLSSTILDMGTLGTNSPDAILDVFQAWNTSVTDLVELRGGILRGADINNDGPGGIVGHGSVIAKVKNESKLAAENGTLIVANVFNDWDGSSGLGQLHALAGDLHLSGEGEPEPDGFNGGVSIAQTHELFIADFDMNFKANSTITMAGGTLRADAHQTFGGMLQVLQAPANIDANARFTLASLNTIDDDLNLRRDTVIDAGAVFQGTGTLASHLTGILTLRDGADLNVDLDAHGTLIIEDGIGHARVIGDARSLSLLMLELGGPSDWQYDRLIVTDTLTVRGIIDVQLLNYDPVAGDVFNVLDFADFIAIYTLQLPDLSPGLAWDVSEFETLGELKVLGTVVPEPTSLTLLALGAAALLRRRRLHW